MRGSRMSLKRADGITASKFDSYREIPENRVLAFPATPGFKGWRDYFCEASTTHPAKINLNLLRYIIKTYTKIGDVILDPMAGTGSTAILAALMGRHGIAVEYEPKFCEMIRENIRLTELQATLTPKGRMACIQGDARRLSKLLKEADAIITSPPYGSDNANLMSRKDKSARSIVATTGERAVPLQEENIGNLKYGKPVDEIITSPPYSGISLQDYGSSNKALLAFEREVREAFKTKGYYEHDGERYTEREWRKINKGELKPRGMPELWKEILKQKKGSSYSEIAGVDAVITSPPYEGSLSHSEVDLEKEASAMETDTRADTKHRHTPGRMRAIKAMVEGYPSSEDNIGNLKSESYLSAMLQCYREMWKVLKDQGKLIVVIKNFIRKKAVVRLDSDTIKLCEAAGFALKERWYFKLPQKSFWRVLYHKKYPEVPEVEYEDILIFRKVV